MNPSFWQVELKVMVFRYFYNPPSKQYFKTAHNWQNEKEYSRHVPALRFYRDEAVGLKSCKYT